MDPLVFRAALRTTMKIAFTAAVVGCGGSSSTETVPDAAHATDTGMTRNDGSRKDGGDKDAERRRRDTGPSGDGALACSAPSPDALFHTDASASAVSSATFDCCVAELEPLLSSDSGMPADSVDAAAADPNVLACCGVVVFATDHDYGGDAGEAGMAEVSAYRNLGLIADATCCEILRYPVGPTCTPWGPPVPPDVPGEASAEAGEEVA